MQCFITIFAQHLTVLFLHVLCPLYNRKRLPTKIHFRRSKPLSYKVFCDHFSCALSHTNHKLIQLYHTIHLTACQVKIALNISMYFLQNTIIKHFTHHLFFTNISVRSLHIVFALKRSPTILPVRRACYMNTFVWAARPSIFYVSVLNDFVAGIRKNILCASIFDCSGFLRAREYHFLSEGYKNRLEWIKLSVLFLCFFWTVFGVYFCAICTNSI